jgi:hypothetical protein
MKKFSKKGLLLFAGVMAVCAFAMPAMSSAASWGVIGTEHTLHSANLGFTAADPMLGGISSSCAASTFTVDVRNAAQLNVTSTSFTNCTGQGNAIGDCTVTATGTPEPNPAWTATGITTSNVAIDAVRIDVTFEDKPGAAAGVCANVVGQTILLTGNLTSGTWNPATHSVTYNNAEGLAAHGATGNGTRLTVSGTIRDTAQTLTLS